MRVAIPGSSSAGENGNPMPRPGYLPAVRLLSLSGYQPFNVVTNENLAATLGISDEWIRRRTGITRRPLAGADESVADMAVAAGAKALAASGLAPGDIDLVIVATCTQETQLPNVAATVAHRLGLASPGAYDVNAACAGFCYALANASDAVRAGSARNALVIGAEKLSSWVDWNDRATCIIFADGAGAAVVAATDDQRAAGMGVAPVVWGSAGDAAGMISVRDRNSFIVQDGQSVFRWATSALVPVARGACEMAGITPEQLAAFVPHQANLRILETLARRLGIPRVKMADDVIEAGNTSAASIPLALSRMIERGDLRSGDPVLLLGYGAGLTYAAQVVNVP